MVSGMMSKFYTSPGARFIIYGFELWNGARLQSHHKAAFQHVTLMLTNVDFQWLEPAS